MREIGDDPGGGDRRAAPGRGRWDTALTVFAGVSALALALALVVQVRQRLNSAGPYRTEYEGRILDKSVTLVETEFGSRPVHRLHLAGGDGARFEVIVNRDFYERAQVGMWVSNGRDGAKLSQAAPPAAGAGQKAEGAEPPPASAPQK